MLHIYIHLPLYTSPKAPLPIDCDSSIASMGMIEPSLADGSDEDVEGGDRETDKGGDEDEDEDEDTSVKLIDFSGPQCWFACIRFCKTETSAF